REEIAARMQESAVFVLASRAETFGVVYIEAMASGLPVIATKCGGPEGFVNTENGVLIEIDDLKGLIYAMQHMITKQHLYNREEISRAAQVRFSTNAVANLLMSIYTTVHSENDRIA
ncbi:MAG: glycosyltransferase family 4 protein, partial [Chloroflexi bacterium]|nr:glycosyltransferase family 4 protein [Chloroflexota bacterium]